MPRSSYLQPVGNPTQVGQQPKHHLDMEFLYTGGTLENTQQLRRETLTQFFFVELAIVVILGFFNPVAYGLLGVTLLVYFAMWSYRAFNAGEYWGLARVSLCVLFGCVVALARSNWSDAILLIMAALLSNHTLAVGQHWIVRCSTSPLSRDEILRWRSAWTGHLYVAVAIPWIAAVAALYFGSPYLFPLILSVFCVVQLFLCRKPLSVLQLCRGVFSSWCAYNAENIDVPGLAKSPAGSAEQRQARFLGDAFAFSILCALFSSIIAEVPLQPRFVFLVLPGVVFLAVPFLLQVPLLEEASEVARRSQKDVRWESTVRQLRDSENPVMRTSYYMGHVASDGSPFLLPREVFNEPCHFLGSTGAGKTSKGLAPWLEQTIGFGDSSVIFLDLKADTLEPLATMIAAEENLRRRTGKHLPLKVFSSQDQLPMHGFNPLGNDFWHSHSLFERTDILCGALGLIYGSDYGEGYYSSANAMTLYETLKAYPNIRSLRELAERCHYVLTNVSKFQLLPNTAKNADHLYSQLQRLAAFEQLQVCADGRFSTDVIEHSIDLASLFQRPQMLYLHLSASLGAGSAPAIARLFTYLLLTTATRTERQCRVHLVIDEFQRMVADNLEYILQLARSMGISLVLANQSIADLKTRKTDMISVIESNCRFRQWFDVPSEEDRRRLLDVAGETVELVQTNSFTSSSNGNSSTHSTSELILPRLNINEILRIGDDPNLSIVRLARGGGYAQLAGLPTVIRSGFHISEKEYERRKAMQWPALSTGMFVPADLGKTPLGPRKPAGPIVIRHNDDDETDIAPSPLLPNLFENTIDPDTRNPKKRRKEKE